MYSHQRRRGLSTRRIHLESLEPRRMLSSFTVDTLVDENDGNSEPGDFSLREAIAAAAVANDGKDTISFDSSLANGTIHLSQGLLIQSSLSIDGGANNIVIDAGGDSRVLSITFGAVFISNLLRTGGHANSGGGLHIIKTGSIIP